MTLPRAGKDIVVIKQGSQEPQYDENSRQIDTCKWTEVEHLVCVEHFPTSRGAEADTTLTFGLESYRELETFYFSIHNQSHCCNFDIQHGYYILQRVKSCPKSKGGIKAYKVVAIRTYEIIPGCWDVKMAGEILGGRELHQLMLECDIRDDQLDGIVINGN